MRGGNDGMASSGRGRQEAETRVGVGVTRATILARLSSYAALCQTLKQEEILQAKCASAKGQGHGGREDREEAAQARQLDGWGGCASKTKTYPFLVPSSSLISAGCSGL